MAIAIVKPKTTPQLLPPEVKRAIVKWNAEFMGCTEITERVKEEFGLQIGQSLTYRYDPTRTMGAELSSELKDYFYACRRSFSEEMETVPGSVRAVRMQRLDTIYHACMKKGDHKAAIAALTALRQEVEKFEVVDDDSGDKEWSAA